MTATLQERRNKRQKAEIPKSAELVASYTFTRPADNAKLEVDLYEGRASFGRASNYKRIPCRWMLLHRHKTAETTVHQYSGKRYDLPLEQIEQAKAKFGWVKC